MERSWLSKAKQKRGNRYAVKNLSGGLLSIGSGHLRNDVWATNLSEWEVSRRGFLANPKTDKWLCVTDRGRYVVGAVCMIFDRYLREGRHRASSAKVL